MSRIYASYALLQRELKALQVEVAQSASKHADTLKAVKKTAEGDAAAHKKKISQQLDKALQVGRHAATKHLGEGGIILTAEHFCMIFKHSTAICWTRFCKFPSTQRYKSSSGFSHVPTSRASYPF